MSVQDDFVSDLNSDGTADTVLANTGNVETHRGSDDVGLERADAAPKPVEEAEVPAKPLSLREQISTALKGGDTPAAAQIDGGLVRDPVTGQFVPKPVTDPNAAAQPPAPVVQLPQGSNIPGLTPEILAALPAETQQHVARTMETLNQQATRYAAYDQIERVIAPRRQGWALSGMSEGQVVNQLFALSDFAEQRPDEFIRYFAEQRGLDLEALAFGPEPTDPATAAALQRIQQLETQISGFATQQQQQAHTAIVDEIVQFADEKGADGKTLLRPYFAELGNDVLPFIQQAMQKNPNRPRTEILTEAYECASWANPSVRAKMQAAADAAREAERLKASTAAATRAKQAGVGVAAGTPEGGDAAAASASTGSLRGDIRAAIAASS